MIKLPYGPHTHTLICGQTPPMVNHPRVKPPYDQYALCDTCPNGQVARMETCPNGSLPEWVLVRMDKLPEWSFARMDSYPNGHFNFTTTHANMLCHILGLKQEVGDWLYGLDVSIKIHQTELQLLEKYLKEKENQLKEERAFENLDKEDLIGHLQKLGFTEERSISITNMLPRQLIALQYPSFWAIKYIQNMFDSHPLLSVFKQ